MVLLPNILLSPTLLDAIAVDLHLHPFTSRRRQAPLNTMVGVNSGGEFLLPSSSLPLRLLLVYLRDLINFYLSFSQDT